MITMLTKKENQKADVRKKWYSFFVSASTVNKLRIIYLAIIKFVPQGSMQWPRGTFSV